MAVKWGGRGPGHLSRMVSLSSGTSLPTGAVGLWLMSDYSASPRPYVPNRMDATAAKTSMVSPGRRVFSNTNFWQVNAISVTENGATAPDGKTEAAILTCTAGSGWFIGPKGATAGAATDLPNGTYTVAVNIRWRGTGTTDIKLGTNSGGQMTTFTTTTSWARYARTVTISGGTAYFGLFAPTGNPAGDFEICDFEVFAGSSDLGPCPIASHLYFQKRASTSPAPTLTSGVLDLANNDNVPLFQLPTAITAGAFTLSWCTNNTTAPSNVAFQAIISSIIPNSNKLAIGLNVTTNSYPLLVNGGVVTGSMYYSSYLDSINRGINTHTLTYDGTTMKLYSGGFLLFSVSATFTAQVLSDFYMNIMSYTNYAGLKYGGLALWTRALSYAEVQAATAVINANVTTAGSSLEPARVLMYEGDSITAGSTCYSSLAVPNITPSVRAGNYAVGGSTIATLASRASALDAFLPSDKGGKKFILHVLVGTNDLGYGGSAAFITSLQSYLSARRSAGWDKIVCGTIISKTLSGLGPQFDIDRGIVNPVIRGWVGTIIDAVADYAANANVGGPLAADNLTYFSDKVHPTAAGHAEMHPITTAALSGLWGY